MIRIEFFVKEHNVIHLRKLASFGGIFFSVFATTTALARNGYTLDTRETKDTKKIDKGQNARFLRSGEHNRMITNINWKWSSTLTVNTTDGVTHRLHIQGDENARAVETVASQIPNALKANLDLYIYVTCPTEAYSQGTVRYYRVTRVFSNTSGVSNDGCHLNTIQIMK